MSTVSAGEHQVLDLYQKLLTLENCRFGVESGLIACSMFLSRGS